MTSRFEPARRVSFLIVVFTIQPCLAGEKDPEVLVDVWGSSNILRFDSETGGFVSTFAPGCAGGLGQAHSIRPGPLGNLYVTSNASNAVLEFMPDGTLIGPFTDGGPISGPGGGQVSRDCRCADIDGDNDVDLVDFSSFQLAFSGPM
jgi:hypothetical protein